MEVPVPPLRKKRSRLSSQQRRRHTIARAVYEDRWGISAIVDVTPFAPIEKRFPLGTSIATIQAWQYTKRAELKRQAPVAAAKGTLAADAPRFLDMLPDATRAGYAILLQAWIDAPVPGERGPRTFGLMPRDTITEQHIRQQLAIWSSPPCGQSKRGLASNTLRHRVRALRVCYRTLDGKAAPNPCAGLEAIPKPKGDVRDVPVELVQLLLANLPDRGRPVRGQTKDNGPGRSTVSLSKIRLHVMAWTGLPQMQLERLRRRDVRFEAAELYRRPRRKGQGVEGSWTKLIPPAVEALRAYDAAKLWEQPFSRDSLKNTWKRTVTRTFKAAAAEAERTGNRTLLDALTEHVPPKCRPYDLRHAFLSEAYRVTGDLGAVSELAQHADLRMTQRYTKGAVSERARIAIEKMSARWLSSPPVPPPAPAAQKKLPRQFRLVR